MSEVINEFLFGRRIVITDVMTKTIQSRCHKKKRINKKWIKRYGYKDVVDNNKIFAFQDALFMTEKAYEKIRNMKEVEKL